MGVVRPTRQKPASMAEKAGSTRAGPVELCMPSLGESGETTAARIPAKRKAVWMMATMNAVRARFGEFLLETAQTTQARGKTNQQRQPRPKPSLSLSWTYLISLMTVVCCGWTGRGSPTSDGENLDLQ